MCEEITTFTSDTVHYQPVGLAKVFLAACPDLDGKLFS
jgi:hypothetical protein